jgi:hypothetical protein
MKTTGTTLNKLCHLMNCLLFGLVALLIILPSASASEFFPPQDDDCRDIPLSVDATPAETYKWLASYNGQNIVSFKMKITVSNRVDDLFEIQYSPDGGGYWIDLEFNMEVLVSGAFITFSAGNETINDLQLRVNTDKVRRGDGANLELCHLEAELEAPVPPEPPTIEEPTITQSAFVIYENVADFYAVTPNISGDTRAQAIAIDDTFMYVAGQVPLGTVRGWRIEKRNAYDGELLTCANPEPNDCVVTVANGGEPHAIVLSGNSIYVVGNAYIDGEYFWDIVKLDSNLNLDTNFDIDNFSGTAYAAVS